MSSHPEQTPLQRSVVMACLILAGEAIFGLPFHVARFFRPTVLRAFALTNSQLGAVQASYGVMAMISYFPGGPLADRFSARKLMTASMVATAAGGLYFATMPGIAGLYLVWGFWGMTTILLFWAALIRTTREWGSADEQGKAFGILDGGRGVVAAVLASVAVLLLGLFFPADPATATDLDRIEAIRKIIYVYTAVTLLTGVVIWFLVPEPSPDLASSAPQKRTWEGVGQVLKLPAIWLQAAIIICAYVGYKGLDNYSLFAVDAYAMDEVEGAAVSALAAWIRPVAAVGAGLLGDRIRSSVASAICFGLMLLCYLVFALGSPDPASTWVLYADVIVACAGVFGLRGLYFALFEEAALPARLTGTATGVVSVVGYTPDIFVSPAAGWLLDRSPGVVGHQHFFLFMATFAAVGLLASHLFARVRPGA